jgi:LPS sulfotransferase NodH
MLKTTIHQLLQKVRSMPSTGNRQQYNAVRNLNIWRGHREYSKFVILGRSRSGSNLLRGLLNSHSQVITFGELFQNDKMISWGFSDYPQSPHLMELFRQEPLKFLERYIWREVPQAIHSVGFKLFYYHAHSEQWQPVWDYLVGQPTLKVIHIKRANMLKTHLSRKKAILTDRWVNTAGTSDPHMSVTLDYEECLADFMQTSAWEQEYAKLFANHAVLDICYEELARDFQVEMKRVQDFLEVKPQVLLPETHRQSDYPLPASIDNYYELKERFVGTDWQSFFED